MTKILVAITKKTKNTIKRENEWKTGFTLETWEVKVVKTKHVLSLYEKSLETWGNLLK